MTQALKAHRLRELHQGSAILVLPNAWDCASARIVEELGFPAIATTSAGIAFSFGYPDGQRISREEMIFMVKRIAACVQLPVTADLEAGYDGIAQTASDLIQAGAVGLNLEDLVGDDATALVPLEEQVEKIRTVRRIGRESNVEIVINARTDIYLAQIGEPAGRFEHACNRLRAYIDAGADCLFVPGVKDEKLIRQFVETLQFPLNVLATAGTPPVSRLQELGVARVSMGSGLARAALGAARRAAEELRLQGTYGQMLGSAIPYAELNSLFEHPPDAK